MIIKSKQKTEIMLIENKMKQTKKNKTHYTFIQFQFVLNEICIDEKSAQNTLSLQNDFIFSPPYTLTITLKTKKNPSSMIVR